MNLLPSGAITAAREHPDTPPRKRQHAPTTANRATERPRAPTLPPRTEPRHPAPRSVDPGLSHIGIAGPANGFESQHLDFKRAADSIKGTLVELADAAVCFANAEGGTVVLGVDEKASSRAGGFVGIDPGYTVDLVRKGIYDRTAPHMTVSAREHVEEGVRLLVIDVVAGIATYSNTAGLATRRMGTECLPFTPQQQREVLIARGRIDWSADSSGLPWERLPAPELQRARQLLLEVGKERLAELGDKPLLEALRLVAEDGTVTNAGIILFGTEEQLREAVPNYGYSYQYRPTAGSEASYRFRGQAPLLRAAEGLLNAVERRIEVRPLNLAGGVQVATKRLPLSGGARGCDQRASPQGL